MSKILPLCLALILFIAGACSENEGIQQNNDEQTENQGERLEPLFPLPDGSTGFWYVYVVNRGEPDQDTIGISLEKTKITTSVQVLTPGILIETAEVTLYEMNFGVGAFTWNLFIVHDPSIEGGLTAVYYLDSRECSGSGIIREKQLGDITSVEWYKELNLEIPLSFGADQYDAFGHRFYNMRFDFNLDGKVTQAERFEALNRAPPEASIALFQTRAFSIGDGFDVSSLREFGTFERIETPAGTFDALPVELELGEATLTYYFARGFGLVKFEYRTQDRLTTLELLG